ncbi:hypothetical protein B0H14DRAFT_3014888, partial [Mycena olivaceomarginata]
YTWMLLREFFISCLSSLRYASAVSLHFFSPFRRTAGDGAKGIVAKTGSLLLPRSRDLFSLAGGGQNRGNLYI